MEWEKMESTCSIFFIKISHNFFFLSKKNLWGSVADRWALISTYCCSFHIKQAHCFRYLFTHLLGMSGYMLVLHSGHVLVRRQSVGNGSPTTVWGSGSESGRQVWQPMPLPVSCLSGPETFHTATILLARVSTVTMLSNIGNLHTFHQMSFIGKPKVVLISLLRPWNFCRVQTNLSYVLQSNQNKNKNQTILFCTNLSQSSCIPSASCLQW